MRFTRPLSCKASLCLLALSNLASLKAIESEVSLAVTDSSDTTPYVELELDYFLDPITHSSSTPWMETPWLDRARQLSLYTSYNHQSIDIQTIVPSADGYELDFTFQAFEATYLHRNKTSQHSFGASLRYDLSKFEDFTIETSFPPLQYNVTNITERKAHAYTAEFIYDYYIQDDWTIGATAAATKNSFGRDTDSLSVNTKRLWTLKNNQWFKVSADLSLDQPFTSRELWIFDAEAAYYLNPKTSITLGVGFLDGSDTTNYSLGATHFINDSLFLKGEVYDSDYDGSLIYVDPPTTFRIEFGGRF